MKILTGIFRSPGAAEAALQDLHANNFSQDQFILLTPEKLSTQNLTENTLAEEPPGACGANAGQVSGAITGFAGGIVGGALVSLMIPGVGPIVAIGALAFGGSFGALAGGVVGNAVQMTSEPAVPLENHFFYEEALRQGAQVLVIQINDDKQEECARNILAKHGAENATQAREQWWQQLRANEASEYANIDGPLPMVEARYRQGFEAALDVRLRGKTPEEKETFLAQHHSAVAQDEAFRRGFTRGESYYKALVERGDPRRSTAFAATEVASANS
jgi:outer membrane lipoprotein SlyB